MSFSIIQVREGLSILSLEGRLDVDSVNVLQPQLMQHIKTHKQATILQMSEVTFMASLGIRMLVEAAKTLNAAGKKLVLLKPSLLVEKTLKSSGFSAVVGIKHDEEQARQLLGVV